MTNSYTPSKDFLRWLALLSATLVVSVIFLGMVQSFLVALILAAITSAMSAKLQAKMMEVTGGREALAAALTLLVLIVAVVAPLIFVAWLAVEQAQGISDAAGSWLEEVSNLSPNDPLPSWVPFRDEIGPYSAKITTKFEELASTLGGFVVSTLGDATRGTANFFLSLFVFFYALFIFLQMERPVIDLLLSYSGLASDTQKALRDRMVSVSRATIKGTLLIGIAQGFLGGIGFWFAGIQGAAFWGVVMAVLSVLPGLGPLLVVFCGVVWLFTQSMATPAIGLAIWGVAVVGTIDNILRPILVGRDAALNDIIILISTLGGLAVFGAAGLVLGPVLAGLFVTLWDTLATDRMREPEINETRPNEAGDESSVLDEELAHDLADLRARRAERASDPET